MWSGFAATEDDLVAIGRALGERLGPGTVVALEGDLGAGKTVLARGIAAGLGVRSRVTSPTFIIVQQHDGGRLPLWHADLYRIADAESLEQLGFDEVLRGGGVVVVEWPSRAWEALPSDHLRIFIDIPEVGRHVRIEATGPNHAIYEPLGG